MTIFTRGAAGLVVTLATAVVVSMVPGADAATAPANRAADRAPAAVASTAAASTALSTSKAGSISSRVNGTFNHGAGKVHGTFVPKRFIQKGKHAYAYGVLHTTLRRADGSLRGRTSKVVSIPLKRGVVDPGKANCQVLDLVLGPLDLNLLGLKVHLDRVVLNIVAASGAGALLGNLICAVAGLLDGTGLLNLLKLVNQLNRILNALRI